MTKINNLLLTEDPLLREPSLARSDIEAMRRQVLTTRTQPSPRSWTWTVTLATALATVVVVGIGVTRRGGGGITAAAVRVDDVARTDSSGGRRQLQFATPGGTRVIWVFNDSFDKGVQQ
ncbi:MAG: hypothetical protein ABI634_04650 [Acidobacteriota bacterium]